jgi:hypothetical protein
MMISFPNKDSASTGRRSACTSQLNSIIDPHFHDRHLTLLPWLFFQIPQTHGLHGSTRSLIHPFIH